MAAYPTFTIEDLVSFSGRPREDFDAYGEQALKQAVVWFKRRTCLAGFPDDEDDAELAQLGIMSLADTLVLIQPHARTLSSPFQAETIGSYSYSLRGNLQAGNPTGLQWFDMAVSELGVCDDTFGPTGGGIDVFTADLPMTNRTDQPNNSDALFPSEITGPFGPHYGPGV